MAFAVGSKVVYPSHGVAQNVRREKRVLDGEKLEYLILEVPQQGWGTSGAMTVAVPENRAEGLGVRPAITKADATEVLDLVSVRDVRVPANWSRPFKNHQEKLKSGDVYQVAEVVRNLALREVTKGLSAGEKAMLVKARSVLVSELSFALDVSEDDALARLQAQLV